VVLRPQDEQRKQAKNTDLMKVIGAVSTIAITEIKA
jgi:hypothetical protein